MKLSRKDWNNYVARLSAINKTAGRKMQAWINKHGTDDVEALVEVAYALATKYGEASSAVACQMYDEIAEIQKAHVPPAEPKAPQHINYVNQAIRSTLASAPSMVPSTVSELVKRTGAETTLKNAKRDGAYFAWVPNGDTCAFCMTLASNGWRKASKKTINGDHAEHIHKNCNCEFAISFNGPGQIEGYDPDKYLEMYEGAEGANWKDKVNSMRRAEYAVNKDFINAQKRAAYAARRERAMLRQESGSARPPKNYEHNFDDFEALSIGEEEKNALRELIKETKENGYEYGVIIRDGIPGKIVTSHAVDKVMIPDKDITRPNSSLLHSHTGTTPPSAADLRRLVNQNVDKVGVVTYNNDVFIVEIGDGWRPSLEEFESIEKAIRKEVDKDMLEQAYGNQWTPDELNYMCVREELYRLSLRFGWKVKGGLL